MATVRPFKAVRPAENMADKVAALPYDVMNTAEARAMVKGKPYSFLHVDKAEIDLPEDTDPYSEQVYIKAAENLKKKKKDGEREACSNSTGKKMTEKNEEVQEG